MAQFWAILEDQTKAIFLNNFLPLMLSSIFQLLCLFFAFLTSLPHEAKSTLKVYKKAQKHIQSWSNLKKICTWFQQSRSQAKAWIVCINLPNEIYCGHIIFTEIIVHCSIALPLWHIHSASCVKAVGIDSSNVYLSIIHGF